MIPEWAQKYKTKGTALEKHGNKEFYLYKVPWVYTLILASEGRML